MSCTSLYTVKPLSLSLKMSNFPFWRRMKFEITSKSLE